MPIRRNRAYCPRCDRTVLVDLVFAGDGFGAVEACAVCDNLMIFDSFEDYLEAERERFALYESCDHDRAEATGDGRRECVYCGLPEGRDPADAVDARALDSAGAA